jgi:hypothetical protein
VNGWWRDRRLPPAIGALGLVVSIVAFFLVPADMARAWLVLADLFIGFPLGAMMLLMLDDLTGGRWGEAIRPWLLAIAGTLPLALLAFVPLLFGLGAVFPWTADPGTLSLTAQHKLAWLNGPGVVLRFIVCAVLWLAIALLIGVWGERVRWRARWRGAVSGIGLGVHSLVFTAFVTDWMMSIEPEFYSTIYPMLVASEELVLVLAAVLLIPGMARRRGGTPRSSLGQDLAKLLVSAVLGWAYLAFMQWVIIWAGDLPDEIGWFLVRMNNGWQVVLWAIVVLALIVPFVGLISTRGKADVNWLLPIVAATLAGQVLEGVWRVAPAFPATPAFLLLLVPAALAMWGLGGAAAMVLFGRVPAAQPGGAHGRAG